MPGHVVEAVDDAVGGLGSAAGAGDELHLLWAQKGVQKQEQMLAKIEIETHARVA